MKDILITTALKGKRIVVLGGTSGIGKATAVAAAASGAKVIVASSKKANVDAAVRDLGTGHEGHVVNLSNREAISHFFKSIGNFDHLIFTAGEQLLLGDLAKMDMEKASTFFGIRFWGAVNAVKYSIPFINQGGSITLTGGGAAHRPAAGWSIGASICAAMEGFTRAMAVELAPLRVNMVVPGLVLTDLWSSLSVEDREKMFAHFGGSLPVAHVGTADEIAHSYLYLITQTYSTGQCIVVDGGGSLV